MGRLPQTVSIGFANPDESGRLDQEKLLRRGDVQQVGKVPEGIEAIRQHRYPLHQGQSDICGTQDRVGLIGRSIGPANIQACSRHHDARKARARRGSDLDGSARSQQVSPK